MATPKNYQFSRKTLMRIQRKLLRQAEPSFMLKAFGYGCIPDETFFDKLLYFLRLKKRKPVISHLPKGGDTIKFRRPKPFTAKRGK